MLKQSISAENIHLFQIVYSEETAASADSTFPILDNRSSARPDWFEYWPIRNHILNSNLLENDFYGFFSPRFTEKTSLSLSDVVDFVLKQESSTDIATFCPQPDMGAFFLNIFEQGETFDPGFIETSQEFFSSLRMQISLQSMVMDSRHVVFSNYFVAKPSFWRRWLSITEALFRLCEEGTSPLTEKLNAPTAYKGIHRKVFLIERIVSLLLCTEKHWKCVAANPFGFAWSMSRFRDYPTEAIMSDALKIAYSEQGFPEYLRAFAKIRQQFQQGSLNS